jgi:hypothetical protein
MECGCPIKPRDQPRYGARGKRFREVAEIAQIEQNRICLRLDKPADLPGWVTGSRNRP